jgi:hypothetical protein
LFEVCSGGKRKKDEISVDCLDFNKKILHTAWHPQVETFVIEDLPVDLIYYEILAKVAVDGLMDRYQL